MYKENKSIKQVKDYYANEQMGMAVYGLAIGIGDIRERLISVYTHRLLVLEGSMMNKYFNYNKENIQLYNNIISSLNKHRDEINVRIDQFVPLLSIDEAQDIAVQIYELNSLVEADLNS